MSDYQLFFSDVLDVVDILLIDPGIALHGGESFLESAYCLMVFEAIALCRTRNVEYVRLPLLDTV